MITTTPFKTLAAALLLAATTTHALAQDAVKVEGAWARASVPGQKATGAFMTLTAPAATQLVGVSSPAAGVAEVHEMAMQGDVMKMRAIESLALPAGQQVDRTTAPCATGVLNVIEDRQCNESCCAASCIRRASPTRC